MTWEDGARPDVVAQIADAFGARARAEHAELVAVLDHVSAEFERVEGEGRLYLVERLERSAVVHELAAVLRVSARSLAGRIHAAEFARDSLPRVWAAFADGMIDEAKQRLICTAARCLRRDGSVEKLDTRAAAYAVSHTHPQVRRWLELQVALLEPVTEEQEQRAFDDRRVHVEPSGDGMSWFMALLPDAASTAIMKKLRRTASAMPDDGRSLDQRQADLVASWLTHGESTRDLDVHAEIGILVPWPTLSGLSDSPGTTVDGASSVTARQVRRLADHPGTRFRLCEVTPDGRISDVKSVFDLVHKGRFAPTALKRAIGYRDTTCQAPGCMKPAAQCDFDHRTPHPEGETVGTNIWPLCRLHHLMKTHGLLHAVHTSNGWAWQLRTGHHIPAEPFTHEPPDPPPEPQPNAAPMMRSPD